MRTGGVRLPDDASGRVLRRGLPSDRLGLMHFWTALLAERSAEDLALLAATIAFSHGFLAPG